MGVAIEICAVLLCLLIYCKKGISISDEYGAYSSDAKELYSFVTKNTNIDDKIIFFKPRVLYLETGRLGFTLAPENIVCFAEADYLILSRDSYGTFDYDIESQYPNESKNLIKIFENTSLKMYKIVHINSEGFQ